MSAALPTTAARADARIVLASTPWGDSGPFHSSSSPGRRPVAAHETFRCGSRTRVGQPGGDRGGQSTMSPLRFRAEFEGEFTARVMPTSGWRTCCVCRGVPAARQWDGGPRCAGWTGQAAGRSRGRPAGLLTTTGQRPAIVVVPWCESSRGRTAAAARIERSAKRVAEHLLRDNGVGAAPSEICGSGCPGSGSPGSRPRWRRRKTITAAGAAARERAIVFPNHPELLRQLGGVSATPTPSGACGSRPVESLHDDCRTL